MDDLGVWMVWRGAVPVVSPSLLVFYHLDPLVELDVVVTGQEMEQVGPHPAHQGQPVLVAHRPGKQELLGDLLHPLRHPLFLPLLTLSHSLQMVERDATVESLQY